MGMQRDLRRQRRERSNSTVLVMWCDEAGEDRYSDAQALDVSEIGLRLQIPVRIRERSYVTLRSESLGIHGRASVRYCSRVGNKYIIGVEFAAGLKRQPKP
jgi:hypothetical protein